MRAGGCTVQQGLTADAANVVKQALALARRRGHAQVTPLHVANTMLSTSNGLFRAACLQSNSHPLQCKALELCFNVALNRLPASSSGAMLAPHSHHYPAISNALIAAFKRAQAHQRRGSVENQQQPLLAVKIEVEQLIISILDDPSVSRVMREAGFSSTRVKTNVEQSVALESPLPPPLPTHGSKETAKPSTTRHPFKDEDVVHVLESMIKFRRRSFVVVGECVSTLKGVVGGMMEMVEKSDVVSEGLRGVKCISVSLSSFSDLQREDVEQKIAELTCLVRSLVGKGVILYLGDLKWITDFRASFASRTRSYYCGVEHMIMELGRLVYGMSENGKLWLMGIATFQTFMRCRNGQHSLESLWGLHPITLPAASLDLSLTTQRNGSDIESRTKIAKSSSCSAMLEYSNLPSWLKDESKRLKNNDISLERNLTFFPSVSPSSSTSFFSYDHQHNHHNNNPKISPVTSNPNSASSSDLMEMEYVPRFREFNAENLNILCNALERKVPWRKEVAAYIAGAILQCRSGISKRKEKQSSEVKVETWLFFEGHDAEAKERLAMELAKVVFGSHSNFIKVSLNHQDYSRTTSTKRTRDEKGLAQEISWNPHRVFLVEDLEQTDFQSRMAIKRAIETGKMSDEEQEVSLCDAIVILSCDTFSFSDGSCPRACSPTVKQKLDPSSSLSLDLNISVKDGDRDDDIRGILEIVDRRIVFKNNA